MELLNNITDKPQLQKKTRLLVATVLCLITLLSLLLRYQHISQLEYNTEIQNDSRDFLAYGFNLANHGVYSKDFPPAVPRPDSFRSPGYPFLIALIYSLSGINLFFVHVIYAQIVLSALLVPLTYLLGRFFLSATWALVGCLLVGFSPHLVTMSSYMLSEILFSFLLLNAIILMLYGIKTNNLILFIVSGLFWGAAYLTNETVTLLPPFILGIFVLSVWRAPQEKWGYRFTKGMVVLACVFFMFFAGWKVRNVVSLTSDSSTGMSRALNTLTHGSYPGFMLNDDPSTKHYPYRYDPQQPAYSQSLKNFVSIFSERFSENPLRYLSWYLLQKPYYIWSWSILQGQSDIYIYQVNNSLYETSEIVSFSKKFMKTIHPVLLLFSLAGLIFLLIRWKSSFYKHNFWWDSPILLYIVMIYITIIYSIFAPWPRYSVPLRPELYLTAIWGLATTVEQLKKKLSGNV